MELHDYMLPSSKASWGSKTVSKEAEGSYNLPLSGNLESCNEFDVKYTQVVSLYNMEFLF